MERQKRAAVIHDLAGYGRCALSVAIPVISAEGIECCALPTCILSSNAAFPGYYRDDGVDRMGRFLKHWDELDLEFAASVTTVPYHAGAAKYFSEKGMEVPTK